MSSATGYFLFHKPKRENRTVTGINGLILTIVRPFLLRCAVSLAHFSISNVI